MADRSLVYRLKADITHYAAGMRMAKGIMVDLGDQTTRATKESEKFRRGLDSFGGAAGRVGLVAAAGLGAAVTVAARFDAAMSKVNAATHESALNMDLLRDAAIKAGADTVFSATEAAAAIENMAKAGISTRDILGGGLDGALNLAAAGSLDVARAAEIAAVAMTQFKLGGDEVNHVADLLAAAAGKANGSVDDLAYALKYAGVPANALGVSIEETTGVLAEFAQAGIIGEQAGTTLRGMLASLAAPSGKAGKAMDEAGLQFYDAQGKFVGLAAAAEELKTELGGMTDAERNANLVRIFGRESLQGAITLYQGGGAAVAEWTEKVNDSGYAADTAARNLDNLKGDLERFKGELESALIGTGDGAQGPLRSLTQGATNVVEAYNKLPEATQGAVSGMLAATALLGGGAFFGAKTIQGIANTRVALENLGPAGGKAARGIRLLGGATAVIGGVLALDAAIDGLLASMRDAPLATEEMTGKLLDLRNAGGDASALGKGFEDLGKSLDFFNEQQSKGGDLLSFIPNFTGLFPGENAIEQVDRLKGEFQSLDDALANIVASGSADQARAALEALVDAEGLTGEQIEFLKSQLPGYKEALAGVANAATLGAGSQDALTGATAANTAATESNVATLQEQLKAMRDAHDARIEALDAEIAYNAALDDGTAALKANGKNWDLTTEKGRNNRTALISVAEAWNNLSNKAQNVPGAFRAARQSFIDLAVKMGASREEAKRLARQILDLPSKNIKVTADTAGAVNSVLQLKRLMDSVRDKHVKITASGVHVGGDGYSGGTILREATGGYIRGPGTGTSDSIPAWLSNGEYVINAAATSRHRALLEAINANRYASGGYVGSTSVSMPSSMQANFSDSQLALLGQIVRNAGPLIGNATFVGDRSAEREARQRRGWGGRG